MRNKRISMMLIVVGLLVALTTTVYAASSHRPTTPTIVGVWDTKIQVEGMEESVDALYTFAEGGTFLDINSVKETNPGVWIGSGSTYVVTFWAFGYEGEQGQYNLKAKVRLSIRMNGADQLTGQGVTDVYDLEGNLVEHPWSGPFQITGARVEVELP
ncbi:MAG: hypothetical protein KJZ93_23865 [Caldilineaceae bacterium]|nr:hypothetical protein [Caldilineaceae bacterium]